MPRSRHLLHRIAAFFRSAPAERELAREIDAHLALIEDDLRRDGLTPDAARAAARRAMGGVALAQERHRDARSFLWLEDLRRDTLYACRSLHRSGAFTTVAVLTLALGIGANTAIFSVVHAVLLKPLPYAAPDRLVRLRVQLPPESGTAAGAPAARPVRNPGDLTVRELIELRARTKSLSHVAFGGGPAIVTMTGHGEATRVQGMRVTPGMFALLGVPALRGRTLDTTEEHPAAPPVILLGHDTWRRHFASDPAIVGRTVTLTNALGPPGRATPHTVVGVMPQGFEFPDAHMQFWLPVPWTPQASGSPIARLADGVTAEAAAAEAGALLREITQERRPVAYSFEPLQDRIVEPVKPALLMLSAAVGLVLLIACVNVANLLLARTAARQREIAIRVAIGAGRGRLIRHLLTESLLLALLGGLAGTALGVVGVRLLRSLATTFHRMDLGVQLLFPRIEAVALDGSVLAFTLAISAITGVLFGLAPAIVHSRAPLMDVLRETAASASSGVGGLRRTGARGLLVIAEVAMAMMLLIGGGLLIHSFVKLTGVDPGYDPARVLTFQVAVPAERYPQAQMRTFAETVVARLATVPGVQAAAYARQLPLIAIVEAAFFRRTPERPPRPEPGSPELRAVSRDYLAVMGTRVIAGRGFTEGDGTGGPRVLLINETLARREFVNQHPIGQQVYVGSDTGLWQIVGVVQDVRQSTFDREPSAQVFVDLRQWPAQNLFALGPYFSVRTQGDPMAAVPAVRAIVREVDGEGGLINVASMEQIVANSTSRQRLYATLLGTFAVVAVALAAIGIYGVMAYAVAQRTREIGIRMALGARRSQVMGLMLRQSLTMTAIGIAVGIAGAAALSRYLKGLLFGLTPLDPVTWIAVSVLFVFVAAFAACVPARRATRVDPLIALRAE